MAWIVGTDGFPTNDLFPDMPTDVMTKPYPKALWRIEEYTNDGFPFHELLPDLKKVSPSTQNKYKFVIRDAILLNFKQSDNIDFTIREKLLKKTIFSKIHIM